MSRKLRRYSEKLNDITWFILSVLFLVLTVSMILVAFLALPIGQVKIVPQTDEAAQEVRYSSSTIGTSLANAILLKGIRTMDCSKPDVKCKRSIVGIPFWL